MRPWTFVYVTDIHIGSPRSYRFQPAWNENWETAKQQILEMDPDFLLIGGDLTRDGVTHPYELETVKADLSTLPFPCHIIPGNMDIGNKHAKTRGANEKTDGIAFNMRSESLQRFESNFGPSHWSFVHKSVRFSGFCDILIGSDLPEEKELWHWLEAQIGHDRERFHVRIMHYPPFIDDICEPDFDITDGEQYHCWYFGIDQTGRERLMEIFKATGTTHVISGHIHCRKSEDALGIHFDRAPATSFSQFAGHWKDGDPTLGFLRYDVSQEGIKTSFVPLEKISAKVGYGPGGHPSPGERDYSLAWQKGEAGEPVPQDESSAEK